MAGPIFLHFHWLLLDISYITALQIRVCQLIYEIFFIYMPKVSTVVPVTQSMIMAWCFE